MVAGYINRAFSTVSLPHIQLPNCNRAANGRRRAQACHVSALPTHVFAESFPC